MKKFYLLYFLILSYLSLSICSEQVMATSEDDKLGYTVSMVQPKTQIDPSKSYFYIKTKPNEQQTLEVRVKSTKKEPVNLNIYSVNAITGDAGTIEYTEDTANLDSTLKEPIQTILKVKEPKITVENYEEKTVHIELKAPKEEYKGVKMGALVFALDTGEKEKGGVSTEIAYKVGVITSESGDEFNNSQTLKLNSAKASIKRGKKMILANLQNPEPKTLENLTIEATMFKKGTEEVIKKKTVQNFKMAPNSQFDFEIDWGIDSLPSGEYTLELNASNDYKKWELSKDFSITNQQAQKFNEESAFKIITPSWIKVVTILFIVITTGAIAFIMIRRKKWEQAWKKIRIAKKKKSKKREEKKRVRKGNG